MKRILLFLFLLFPGLALMSSAQETSRIKTDVFSFIHTGNVEVISKYFEGYLDLTLPGFRGVTNTMKAKSLLKDFMKKEKPANFKLKKEGTTDNNYFIIGNINTGNKNRIIYFLFKNTGKKYIIQQLEIR